MRSPVKPVASDLILNHLMRFARLSSPSHYLSAFSQLLTERRGSSKIMLSEAQEHHNIIRSQTVQKRATRHMRKLKIVKNTKTISGRVGAVIDAYPTLIPQQGGHNLVYAYLVMALPNWVFPIVFLLYIFLKWNQPKQNCTIL